MPTEEEAISNLMSQVLGDEVAEEVPVEEVPAEAPKGADAKIDVAAIIKQVTDQQQKLFDEKLKAMEAKMAPKEEAPQMNEEAMQIEEARRKLGLDMEAQEAARQMMEERKQREHFAQVEREFKREFPDIDLKEMGEWAEEVGMLEDLNSGDINRWKLVANLMKRIAAPKSEPDPITPSATRGAETSVWERQSKGEQVDDLEIGAAILAKTGHF